MVAFRAYRRTNVFRFSKSSERVLPDAKILYCETPLRGCFISTWKWNLLARSRKRRKDSKIGFLRKLLRHGKSLTMINE